MDTFHGHASKYTKFLPLKIKHETLKIAIYVFNTDQRAALLGEENYKVQL